MAQRRMIYAQLAENKNFASMSDKAQKTYIFLIVLADDDGRLKGDSEWLRIKIFPYDVKVTVQHLKSYLQEIVKAKLVIWYKDGDNYYIQHPNWTKFQILRADRKKESDIPPPDDNQMSTKRVRKLSKDKIREEKEENSISYLQKIPEKDLQELYERFDGSKKAIQSKAEDLFNYCEGHGKKYRNYKAMLLNALKKDFPERKKPTPAPEEKPEEESDRGRPFPQKFKDDIAKIIGKTRIKE